MTATTASHDALVTREVDGGDVSAAAPLVDELARLVREHGTLYAWASAAPQPQALRGRAPVYVATLPTDGRRVVVRHAWHGGLLAPLTGDRFRFPSRAPIEHANAAALRAAGIATTDVLGFARYAAGPGLVRVDVVSAYLPDTADLGMVLACLAPAPTPAAALEATHVLLDTLAAAGVVHPDLNVKNILLRARGNAAEALVIDVDVVDIDVRRAPVETMQRNVARLTRSMRKWRTRFGCALADVAIETFAAQALARVGARAGVA
ncbi:MAG: hypothetical protein LCH84_16900 [Gemmatimonadetes bacterium]|nr:hypothetical protein [Gemmatimonadota bacterium]